MTTTYMNAEFLNYTPYSFMKRRKALRSGWYMYNKELPHALKGRSQSEDIGKRVYNSITAKKGQQTVPSENTKKLIVVMPHVTPAQNQQRSPMQPDCSADVNTTRRK
jgi:hypothetical protein